MKRNRYAILVALAATVSLSLSACAANESGSAPSNSATSATVSGSLNGIGSSAQGTAETTWIAGFQTANSKVTINYDPQGSGAGRKSFISGAADFAGSDAHLSDAEAAGTFAGCAAGSKAIDLPVYISPIAIAFNVDGVKNLNLDADTIAGIFSGAITTWNDPKIAALNAGTSLPAAAITVVHRSDDSGTTQNFTEYLAANAPTVWTKPSGQTFPYQIGDAAKGTSGVATSVKNAKNSIAYIDESGSAGLDIAKLKVGSQFVKISAAGAADVAAKSPLVTGRPANDIAVNINRKITDANAWPIVLISYLITCQQYKDASKAALVKAYVDYVAGPDAQKASAAQAGSAPLSSELAAKVKAAANTIK
ncbi:phosphate ABC transporter substrate-binding protein PstS [Leifsonia sp. L25]|uniref:phosphate ABC transporter substrate-binding protein PstS n=1 Tax=Actinomycetes TaxID=1760 RepID=UPI003D69BA02